MSARQAAWQAVRVAKRAASDILSVLKSRFDLSPTVVRAIRGCIIHADNRFVRP